MMDVIRRPIDLHDRIMAMRNQEDTAYACADYLDTLSSISAPVEELSGLNVNTSSNGVNELWREKICEWSYQVVDHFDFNREVVAISLSYLDRFLSTRSCNKKVFQLAAMTSLYLAIKLNEPRTLKMSSLVELSRGYFTADHIAAMEEAVLRALEWRMHPPTPLAFVRHLLSMLRPGTLINGVWHDVMEMSRFLTELSVCDYFFVNHKPSTVAMAAIINSIESIGEDRFSTSDRVQFFEEIHSTSGLRQDCDAVVDVRNMLRQMYSQSTGSDHQEETVETETGRFRPVDDRLEADSPVCVGQIDSTTRSSPLYEQQYYSHSTSDYMLHSHINNELQEENIPSNPVPPSRKTSKTAYRTRPGAIN